MKIISYENAKNVMLFPTEEMRPDNGSDYGFLVMRIAERYGFKSIPDVNKSFRDLTGSPLTFSQGRFEDGAIKEFAVYPEGLVVDGLQTSTCMDFLDDVLDFSYSELGLKTIISQPRHYYSSTVVVEFENSIDLMIRKFDRIKELASRLLKNRRGIDQPVSAFRLGFGVDRLALPANTAASDFVIERRANVPFTQNRYFSDAPLPTDEHLEFLEAIEAILNENP
jgi:hypothetical protein